jgi:hypothetical protein
MACSRRRKEEVEEKEIRRRAQEKHIESMMGSSLCVEWRKFGEKGIKGSSSRLTCQKVEDMGVRGSKDCRGWKGKKWSE